MAIPVEIQGISKNNGLVKAEVFNPAAEGRPGNAGLVVYQRDRDEVLPQAAPFLNDEFGSNLNQDGAFGGTPIEVHDGIDNVYWTGSSIIGTKVTFDSTDTFTGWPPSGTKSVKIDNSNAGDIWQFNKGSSQDLSAYSAISMKVLVDKDWTPGDSVSIYGWETAGGTQVGNKVLLEDYIDETNFDAVQAAAIPLSDMGLTGETIYAIRMQQEAKAGKAPKFYIDDLQIEETGEAIEFIAARNAADSYRATHVVITMVDALAGTLANGAGMIPVSYDKFLGISTLTNGIGLKFVTDGEVNFDASLTSLMDFLSIGYKITNAGSDGTNTFITFEIEFTFPLMLRGATALNFFSVSIADDMTGLLRFNARLRGGVVVVDDS